MAHGRAALKPRVTEGTQCEAGRPQRVVHGVVQVHGGDAIGPQVPIG